MALRRLFFETMGFEGTFKVTKDYLQPILKQTAVSLPIFFWLSDDKRSAIIVGTVYFLLYLFSTVASRNSYRFSAKFGGEHQAANTSWKISLAMFLVLIPAMVFKLNVLAILVFIGLEILQNFWRPVQVTRFDTYSDTSKGATILSIDSQAKSLFTMIVAPLLGLAVDYMGFGVIGLLGTIIATATLITSPWKKNLVTFETESYRKSNIFANK
jgi:hypothetical protein